VVNIVAAIAPRAPAAANKTLKAIKTFFNWCIGRAILDRSPAEGVPLPSKNVTRDRVLSDEELTRVVLAARQIGGIYGGIVELLALTGQRREEVSQLRPQDLDMDGRTWTIPSSLAKNGKPHIVHLSDQAMKVLEQRKPWIGGLVFSRCGRKSFQGFSGMKRELDDISGVRGWRLHDLRRTCVSGMARLGIAPHVADKILNHQTGTISGVAAVYQRHQFLEERRQAMDRWGAHIEALVEDTHPGATAYPCSRSVICKS